MNKAKWYIVCNDPLGATVAIEGVRIVKNISAIRGYIIPHEYFAATPVDRVQLLLERGDIQAYQPQDDELEILYTCFPALVPKSAKFKRQGTINHKEWYQVGAFLPYGLAALVDIDGICKRGDVAFEGDIIPRAFLSALSMEQVARLESQGLVANRYLESLAPDVRKKRRLVGAIQRYFPDRYQLQDLMKQFPAMNPNHVTKNDTEELEKIEEGD